VVSNASKQVFFEDPRSTPSAPASPSIPACSSSCSLLAESSYWIFSRALLPRLPPAASGFWMVGLGMVQLAMFAGGRLDWRVLVRHRWFFITIGLLVGVNTNLGFLAMRYVEPGTASPLSRTAIVFGGGLGVLWLCERLTRVQSAGAALAIAGAILVSAQPGDHLRAGSLVVVVATLLYALHSAIVKRWGGQMPFLEFFFFRLAAPPPSSACSAPRRASSCGRGRRRGSSSCSPPP
jgi:drug/metabolite transporter (DMT)-like permease